MSRRHIGFGIVSGFTLVELLVVIAVIGMLAGMLLPVIQTSRESARRMMCLNNLRQIGLGMLSYHDANKRFPEGGFEMRVLRTPENKLRWPKGRQLAWSAFILPYMEFQTLSRRIDFTKAFDSPENAVAAAEIVPIYLCPSNPRKSYLVNGRGIIDYGGIYGETIVGTNSPPTGIMLYSRYVNIHDIIDGTAHTIMISEDCVKDSWWQSEQQWINGANCFDVSGCINTADENDLHSKHPQGVNALFADGNARFLSDDLDPNTLAALCTRNGKEPLGDY
jgi:prepilin-type N-terminal cleavage/methylation domain-containing protein/prepilin-type processing-associated H-X9-DG protein